MQKKLEKQKGTGSFVQTIEQKASFVSRPSTKGQKRIQSKTHNNSINIK